MRFKLFIKISFFLFLQYSSFGQISKTDWKILNTRSNLTLNDSLLIGKKPAQFLLAEINIKDALLKITNKEQLIQLPSPDGSFSTFRIQPMNIADFHTSFDGMAKTYAGYMVGRSNVLIACSIYDKGMYAAVYDGTNTYVIEPLNKLNSNEHIIFKNNDLESTFICGSDHRFMVNNVPVQTKKENQSRSASNIRNYRIAITTTKQYSSQFGGSPFSKNNVHNAIISGLALIEPIFRRDLGVTFTYVRSDALIADANSDTYNIGTNQDVNQELIDNANSNIGSILGFNNFDIGHLISWQNLGGLAYVGGVCDDNYKAGGVSGSNFGNTSLWIDVFSHEIGHLLGSTHNHSTVDCGSVDNSRYEPGDGSSIMSYSGLCNNSYTNQTLPYFHYASIQQIENNLNRNSCHTLGRSISTPNVDAKSSIRVPKSTPFILVGSGNAATYNWIQYDGNGNGASSSPSGTCSNCTNFRYDAPLTSQYRHFPNYQAVLNGNNNNVTWEKLSSVARTMNFRLVGRNSGSNPGVSADATVVTITNNGPFELTYPNGGESLTSETPFDVTWDVNGTNADAATIDILFSSDNGATYSVLANNTPNDGSQEVTINSSNTSNARILIQGHTNSASFRSASTFYDVSDSPFGVGVTISDNAPSNDNFENALPIFRGDEVTANLQNATKQSSTEDPSCIASLEKDLWYRHTILQEGEISFSCGNAPNSTDYSITVYTPGVINTCIPCDGNTYGYNLTGEGWANTPMYFRVYKGETTLLQNTKNSTDRSSENVSLRILNNTLPIVLQDFSGKNIDYTTQLEWHTKSEINASHFEVENSIDGINWFNIGNVDTEKGDSYETRSYSYTDEDSKGIYYRLKLVDLDGSYEYSDVVIVKHEDDGALTIYPNPSEGDEVNVSFYTPNNTTASISIYNPIGNVVYETSDNFQRGRNEFDINTSSLPKGIYLVQVNLNNQIQTTKLIKR